MGGGASKPRRQAQRPARATPLEQMRLPIMLLARHTGTIEPIGTLRAKLEERKDEGKWVMRWAYEWQNPGPPLSGIWKYTSYCVYGDEYVSKPPNGLVPDGHVIALNALTRQSIDYVALATRIGDALAKGKRFESWQKGLAGADRALFTTAKQTVASMVALIREEIAYSQRLS
jgi:hypothetical protein